MPSCVVKWCRNHTDMKNAGITFHRFPTNKVQREKWVNAVRLERNERDWMPSQFSKICSIHFRTDDMYTPNNGKVKRLRKTAVPICTMVSPMHSNVESSGDLSGPSSIKCKTNVNVQKERYMRRKGVNVPACSNITEKKCETSGIPSGSTATSQQDKPLNTLPEAKEIISNVYRYLQAEFLNLTSFTGNSCDLSPLADILKRTADATGVSEQTVVTVLGERKRAEASARVKTVGRKRKKGSARVTTYGKKRAKPCPSFEEEDVSPIEEDSLSEVSEGDDELADEDTNKEVVKHEIETLKVEIDEEDDWTKGLEPPDSASNRVEVEVRPLETASAVQHSLATTQVTVKTEPDDSEYRLSGTSEQSDTRGETLVVVKIEPSEEVVQTLGPSSVPENKSEHGKDGAAKPPEDSR